MKVYLSQPMSNVVTVPAATTVDEALEEAYSLADFNPCHQCSDSMEPDGEAEALIVYDDQDRIIWQTKTDRELLSDARRRIAKARELIERRQARPSYLDEILAALADDEPEEGR
ncbi:hypothetical protein [Amycolatopsis thermoflava]|uniref:hypothetical protein n=1 Tax=Amycolatopsis thermoflava TaxID=84480 RepID=UPI003EC0B985